jgi:hypothetical protein
MSETLDFRPESLTVGELCDLTDVTGEQLNAVDLSKGIVSPKVLLGLAWIIKRREDPEFTVEQAREIKVVDLDFQGNGNAAAPAARPVPGDHKKKKAG